MVIYRTKEMRGMSTEELKEKESELRKELSRERGLVASGQRPENSGKIREMRKTIARILTVINQRGGGAKK
jgi:large subunit ribosomal protein L29